jgi:hypothetical protein
LEIERTYAELVEAAVDDESIVGLVLTGSRGRRAYVQDDADWDVRLVVRDAERDEYVSRFATPHGSAVEVVVLSLTDFERAGEIGTDSAWDRYSYVGAELVVDKLDGRIGELVDAKSVLPRETARSIAAEELDDYINSYHRSAKNLASGPVVEGRLDAAESIASLLNAFSRCTSGCDRSTSSSAGSLEPTRCPGLRGRATFFSRSFERSSRPGISRSSRAFFATWRHWCATTASRESPTGGSRTWRGYG